MRRLLSLLLMLPMLAVADASVWKVSKNGQHLYLAGTMHVLKAEDYPLPREYDMAYKDAGILVFEADLAALSGAEFQQTVMSKTLYPDGQSLASLLQADVLEQLKAYSVSRNIPLAQLLQMKAGLLSVTISMAELNRYGVTQDGVDSVYYQRAKKDGKPVMGLESAEQQVNFIANMGKGHESELIKQTLAEVDELPEMIDQMRDVWRKGSITGLENLMVKPMREDYPDVYIELLAQRNVNWLPYLEAMMQTKEVEMVLVGAAHMAGEHGLHRLLKAHGYRIEPVKSPY